MRFQERWASGETILADGAMGTMLQAAGLEKGHPPEELNVSQPDTVLSVHRQYVEAGSELILTNSFGGTGLRLAKHGLEGQAYELNRRAAELAREAGDVLVAGSIGPTGEFFAPVGTLSAEEATEAFAEQAKGLADGGVDLLVIETMADLQEVEAAIEGARESSDLPLVCSMTFDTKLHTMMGVSPKKAAETLTSWGVQAIGANCGTGPEEVEKVMEQMKEALPEAVLWAKPNAGVPRLVEGRAEYDATPELMAEYAVRFVDLGVRIVGGCCGSTPEHIAAMARALGKPSDL
ncbi:MAG: methionine synthase [Anaerolineae bacterium]|nr:methionine synthase [Anaerolineae bacterium]NIN94222.1 methionine synthase [Anaerolineae bacterium]NIQ77274.1 methionine synthase [Anaerolineae bacterium]